MDQKRQQQGQRDGPEPGPLFCQDDHQEDDQKFVQDALLFLGIHLRFLLLRDVQIHGV